MRVAKMLAIIWSVVNFTLYLGLFGNVELVFMYPFLVMFVWEKGIKKLERFGK